MRTGARRANTTQGFVGYLFLLVIIHLAGVRIAASGLLNSRSVIWCCVWSYVISFSIFKRSAALVGILRDPLSGHPSFQKGHDFTKKLSLGLGWAGLGWVWQCGDVPMHTDK